MKKFLRLIGLAGLLTVLLTGCEYSPNNFGGVWNKFVIALGLVAGAVLLFFIVLGIISIFYKGRVVTVKVLKKKEAKVLRGNLMGGNSVGYRNRADLSRKARRQKGRIRYSKVLVELDGKEKMLKCNDIVLLDKLMVGKMNKIKIRFGEIIKILK
jgi:hypothetical protein